MLSNKNLFDGKLTAGCDEAGRGCLAGPVFAGAVILPDNFEDPLLNDSKKLSEKKRIILKDRIEEKALCWAVASVSPAEIDEINILNASIKAMHLAIEKLRCKPEALLIDGNKFSPWNDLPFKCIKGGDGKFLNIAAASILAKTYRDEYMLKIDEEHPYYMWKKNKGYPTKEHRQAIDKYSISIYHRKSFRLTDTQKKLKFL